MMNFKKENYQDLFKKQNPEQSRNPWGNRIVKKYLQEKSQVYLDINKIASTSIKTILRVYSKSNKTWESFPVYSAKPSQLDLPLMNKYKILNINKVSQ